jgi:hypothetical protein
MSWWIVYWAAWVAAFVVGLDAIWRLVVVPFSTLAPAAAVAWGGLGLAIFLLARRTGRRGGRPA